VRTLADAFVTDELSAQRREPRSEQQQAVLRDKRPIASCRIDMKVGVEQNPGRVRPVGQIVDGEHASDEGGDGTLPFCTQAIMIDDHRVPRA